MSDRYGIADSPGPPDSATTASRGAGACRARARTRTAASRNAPGARPERSSGTLTRPQSIRGPQGSKARPSAAGAASTHSAPATANAASARLGELQLLFDEAVDLG